MSEQSQSTMGDRLSVEIGNLKWLLSYKTATDISLQSSIQLITMFSHIQDSVDSGAHSLLLLKREQKQIEHQKQDRNRMLAEKRMALLKQGISNMQPQVLTAAEIQAGLQSPDQEHAHQIVKRLLSLLENTNSRQTEPIIEGLFDLDIMSKLLYHMGSTNKPFQSDCIYLLSILISNQSSLFSDSFLRKRGELMLEVVMRDINNIETLRHALFCFANAPSDKLSREFLDMFVPNLLEFILREQSTNLDLLQSFSWFLNSCVDIRLKVYIDLQFKLIQVKEVELTSEVITNMNLFFGQLVETSEQFSDMRQMIDKIVQQYDIIRLLEVDRMNYVSHQQTLEFIGRLIEFNKIVYYSNQIEIKRLIAYSIDSSKDLVASQAIKLITTIAVECRDFENFYEYAPKIVKMLTFRNREIKKQCIRLFVLLFHAEKSPDYDRNQIQLVLERLQQLDERIDKTLLSLMISDKEVQDRIIELVMFFMSVQHPISQQFTTNQRLCQVLQQLGRDKNNEGILLQTSIFRAY